MRIVADRQIPLAEELFGSFGAVVCLPAESITAPAVREADVVLVRSPTRVDAALLRGSSVRFVGSATIGTDHVDLDYLRAQGIAFAFAPGSNARSVADYVIAAVVAVFAERGEALDGRAAGVVGLGAIGSQVARRLAALGLRVAACDPPLARRHPHRYRYHRLEDLLDAVEVLTLHVPLTRGGPDPTWHLIGRSELGRLRSDAVLLNTSRGAVVDNRALREALAAGRLQHAVLDVWEGEPAPDTELIRRVTIATPHIAGHSVDGKIRGASMLAGALARWLGQPAPVPLHAWRDDAPPAPLRLPEQALPTTRWLDALIGQMYDIRRDDAALRRLASSPREGLPAAFQRLRATYPERRDFERHTVAGPVPGGLRRAVLEGLGVRVGPAEAQRP